MLSLICSTPVSRDDISTSANLFVFVSNWPTQLVISGVEIPDILAFLAGESFGKYVVRKAAKSYAYNNVSSYVFICLYTSNPLYLLKVLERNRNDPETSAYSDTTYRFPVNTLAPLFSYEHDLP